MLDKNRIAYFISPHGYGHAARAAAVMEAMYEIHPAVRFEIFTQVPRWFFDDSLSGKFGYHSFLTDIGLMQSTPLQADLPETVRRLNHFLPFDRSRIRDLAKLVKKLRCGLIICDIAPMGIAVAKEAGIPSQLVENFTWDWIYEGYVKYEGRIGQHINYLKGLFDAADFHIQSEPVCCRRNVNLTTFPVSRKVKSPAHQIRKKLRIPESSTAVLSTMGGLEEKYDFLERLAMKRDTHFVIPGASKRVKIQSNLVLLPHRSDYFHPDLVNACDAVIGKVGYSTVAEIYYAGAPFGFIARSRFRESQKLVSFIKNQMNGRPIAENKFYNGTWLSSLQDLLALPRIHRQDPQGAEQVARFTCDLINALPS
jgi:UDP-N-acetylglucosamine:LPS N-acetylglucosamine transferase